MENDLIQLRQYHTPKMSHAHDFYQWVFSIHGVLQLEVNKKAGRVTLQDAAFIRPGEMHYFESLDENEFLVVDVGVHHDWMSHIDIPTFWSLTPTLEHYVRFAKFYLNQKKDKALNEALVRDFLLKLLSQHFLSSLDKKIQRAKHWIDVHFSTPIDVQKIANMSFLSKSQLQRRFQKTLGHSVGAYWRSVRLQQAQLFLKTGLSVEQTAIQTGYESVSTFSRSFSQVYGVSFLSGKMILRAKKVESPQQSDFLSTC